MKRKNAPHIFSSWKKKGNSLKRNFWYSFGPILKESNSSQLWEKIHNFYLSSLWNVPFSGWWLRATEGVHSAQSPWEGACVSVTGMTRGKGLIRCPSAQRKAATRVRSRGGVTEGCVLQWSLENVREVAHGEVGWQHPRQGHRCFWYVRSGHQQGAQVIWARILNCFGWSNLLPTSYQISLSCLFKKSYSFKVIGYMNFSNSFYVNAKRKKNLPNIPLRLNFILFMQPQTGTLLVDFSVSYLRQVPSA